MDRITVGVTFPSDRSLIDMIAAVSPRLHVVDISNLVAEDAASPQARASLDALLRDVEVLFIGRTPADLAARAPRLKWVQFIGTGVDGLRAAGLFGHPFVVTKVTGANALAIAEHCFLFMLMFVKHMAACMEQQRNRTYERHGVHPDFLEGKNLGILGLGAIGLETARLGKAFHMRVLATRRSVAERRRDVGDVDEIFPPGQLHELLKESDFVVVALPLTQETTHIIGEPELRAMKPSACIINVGRGRLIDEAAMVRALKEGWIAAAGLDVFEVEPLPLEHDLWGMPNVLITPHVAGDVIDHRARATRFFCENLERYLAGQPLRDVVDPAKGY